MRNVSLFHQRNLFSVPGACFLLMLLLGQPFSAAGESLTYHYATGECVAGPGGCTSGGYRVSVSWADEFDALSCRGSFETAVSNTSAATYAVATGSRNSGVYLAQNQGHLHVFSLDPTPNWLTSVVWDAKSEAVVVAGALTGSLVFYSLDGRRTNELRNLSGADNGFSPSSIKVEGGGFLVRGRKGNFRWLNSSFEFSGALNVEDLKRPDADSIASIWSWAPVGKWLVGFADVKLKDGTWHHGIVRALKEDPVGFNIVSTFNWSEGLKQYYLLGHSYVASAGNKAYVLVMAEQPFIEDIGVDGERLRAFPAKFKKIPPFRIENSTKNIADVYEFVTRQNVPVGLFSWDDELYVLGREREGKKTRWTLTRLNPCSDIELGTVVLPTTAEHLTVSPSPKGWILVEKGKVEDLGSQEVGRVLIVSNEWIKERTRGNNEQSLTACRGLKPQAVSRSASLR